MIHMHEKLSSYRRRRMLNLTVYTVRNYTHAHASKLKIVQSVMHIMALYNIYVNAAVCSLAFNTHTIIKEGQVH